MQAQDLGGEVAVALMILHKLGADCDPLP